MDANEARTLLGFGLGSARLFFESSWLLTVPLRAVRGGEDTFGGVRGRAAPRSLHAERRRSSSAVPLKCLDSLVLFFSKARVHKSKAGPPFTSSKPMKVLPLLKPADVETSLESGVAPSKQLVPIAELLDQANAVIRANRARFESRSGTTSDSQIFRVESRMLRDERGVPSTARASWTGWSFRVLLFGLFFTGALLVLVFSVARELLS